MCYVSLRRSLGLGTQSRLIAWAGAQVEGERRRHQDVDVKTKAPYVFPASHIYNQRHEGPSVRVVLQIELM